MDEDNDVAWRSLRQRLRAGEVQAHTQLFQSHVDTVHRVAATLCGDVSLAEDVTADTFLIAWRRRATIADHDEPLLPWLLAIAARQALNATRGRRRQQAFVSRYAHRFVEAGPDLAEEVATRVDSSAQLRRTQAALSLLKTHELEVLVLCVWSGLSIGEVANALGVPPGTVRSRLSRTRRRLRALVGDDLNDSEQARTLNLVPPPIQEVST
ncbi:RNA polymerase sigma factor [Nocardioides aurantiacus]|uniref:RNA polymerase sigma-70 factor (ECF subfamily) n=1 Tax=Nocardioides aurantiacus TaxID=86796 RepID=A0A3N2CTZ4_9ACTN|nr:RNA polymerase sigma factor [Nocardioides aurantiacus]ROR90997.1 RNA polymerase sigma-70 factor (ECF subfamily) [Nocardioides aurantiacus]